MTNPESRKTTKHSATDASKCYAMENRYGWKIWEIEEHPEQPIFKVDCIFLGDAPFPKHWTEEASDDD